jgi:hypothetical protein
VVCTTPVLLAVVRECDFQRLLVDVIALRRKNKMDYVCRVPAFQGISLMDMRVSTKPSSS